MARTVHSAFAQRFWDLQGDKVGGNAVAQRVSSFCTAAKRILDAAVHVDADGTERVGTAAPRTGVRMGSDFLVEPAQVVFDAAAWALADGADMIGIPFPSDGSQAYHPTALLHLFAATIGMLAPSMRVAIMPAWEGQYVAIVKRLKIERYVHTTHSLDESFDVIYGVQRTFTVAAVMSAADAITRNRALYLFTGRLLDCAAFGVALREATQTGNWVRCILLIRDWATRFGAPSWCLEYFTSRYACQPGSLVIVVELLKNASAASITADLSRLVHRGTADFLVNVDADEREYRDAICRTLGDDGNGIAVWPAITDGWTIDDIKNWHAPVSSSSTAHNARRARYVAVLQAHHRTLAFRQSRETLVRSALLAPPLTPIRFLPPLFPLLFAYLQHPLLPVLPEWIPPPPPPLTVTVVGAKRKRSPFLDVSPSP